MLKLLSIFLLCLAFFQIKASTVSYAYLQSTRCNITFEVNLTDHTIKFDECAIQTHDNGMVPKDYIANWTICNQRCCQNYSPSNNNFTQEYLNQCENQDAQSSSSQNSTLTPLQIGIICGVLLIFVIVIGCCLNRYFKKQLESIQKEEDQLQEFQKGKITVSIYQLQWIQVEKPLEKPLEICDISANPIKIASKISLTQIQTQSIIKLESQTQIVAQSDQKQQEQTQCCAICLQKNVNLKISCRHLFHQKCLSNWLKQSHKCPLCNQNSWSFMRLYCSGCHKKYLLMRPHYFVENVDKISFCESCDQKEEMKLKLFLTDEIKPNKRVISKSEISPQ